MATVRACLASVFAGAEIIETHFTLDNSLQYGDHSHSVDPKGLRELISNINLFFVMSGKSSSITNRPDRKNAKLFRRGVYAAKDIKANEYLVEENICMPRPPSNLTPNEFLKFKKKKIKTKIIKNQEIHKKNIYS